MEIDHRQETIDELRDKTNLSEYEQYSLKGGKLYKLLNIFRSLLSVSVILTSLYVITYSYDFQHEIHLPGLNVIILIIISFFGGIALGFISFEDMDNILEKRYSVLVCIKQTVFVLLWAYGLFIGVIVVLWLILMSYW